MPDEKIEKAASDAASPVGLDEAVLVERARRDGAAFDALYNRYYARILNYAFRCTLNSTAAEEITSNTFFNALRALGTFDSRCPFAAWLYRIATNEIRMHWRQRASRQHRQERCQYDLARIYFDRHKELDTDAIVEKMRAFEQLHRCLSALPEKYRTALALRYFEGLAHEQIAQIFKKSPATARTLVHRGLERLRRQFIAGNETFPASLHLD